MTVSNTDQRVNIRKYDENFDRIFKKSEQPEEKSGENILEDVTITIVSKDRVLFEGKYKSCIVKQTRTVTPEYTMGHIEATGLKVVPGSEVLSITAGGRI